MSRDMFGNDLARTDSFGTPRDRETVACSICGTPTPMLGTKLCDRCWELKTRIEADPELAQKILDSLQ